MAKTRQIGESRHTDNLAFARPNLEFAIVVIRDLHGVIMDRSTRPGNRNSRVHVRGGVFRIQGKTRTNSKLQLTDFIRAEFQLSGKRTHDVVIHFLDFIGEVIMHNPVANIAHVEPLLNR